MQVKKMTLLEKSKEIQHESQRAILSFTQTGRWQQDVLAQGLLSTIHRVLRFSIESTNSSSRYRPLQTVTGHYTMTFPKLLTTYEVHSVCSV